MNGPLLEPLKYYKYTLCDKIKNEFTAHFNSLVSSSGVNVEENRATVKKYKREQAHIEKVKKRLFWLKFLSVSLIVLSVIAFLAFVFGIKVLADGERKAGWIMLGVGAGVLILSIILNIKLVRPKIKNSQAILEAHMKNAAEYLALCEKQMEKLNSLFDNEDSFRIIEKCMPEIKFSRNFTNEAESRFHREFDYLDFYDDDKSIVDALSGTIENNPFLFERYYEMRMGTGTYTGSLPISWTERRRDSKGNMRTVHRSQILYASLVKPKPYYALNTYLGYGASAAEDLCFSRAGSHVEDLTEEEREERIKKGEKKLAKKAKKSLAKGGNFREMLNTEFDVLFGATNRNHEVQFRVLFTPLAQKASLDLITSEVGYGDDFKFIKQKRFNIIRSEHAQKWRMHPTARLYRSYDIDDCHKKFMSFNQEYFKSLYFDFAPLMAIPAYHSDDGVEERPATEFKSNYSKFEQECMANAVGVNAFKHPDSATDIILKTEFISKIGDIDRVSVSAYSFIAENRLDFVPTLGGDGRMHPVPVNWIEFLPVRYIKQMAIKALPHTERQFNEKAAKVAQHTDFIAYYHGLMAFPIQDGMTDADIIAEFNKFI